MEYRRSYGTSNALRLSDQTRVSLKYSGILFANP